MTTLQAIGVFAGIPVLVLLVIALPLYGGSWFRRVTRRGTGPDRSHPS